MGGTRDPRRGPRDQRRRCLHVWDGDGRGAYDEFPMEVPQLTFGQTFTGRSPFANFQLGVFNIVSGKRPKRPDMLRHDRLWEIVEMCWNQEPKKRPTIPQLLEFFQMS